MRDNPCSAEIASDADGCTRRVGRRRSYRYVREVLVGAGAGRGDVPSRKSHHYLPLPDSPLCSVSRPRFSPKNHFYPMIRRTKWDNVPGNVEKDEKTGAEKCKGLSSLPSVTVVEGVVRLLCKTEQAEKSFVRPTLPELNPTKPPNGSPSPTRVHLGIPSHKNIHRDPKLRDNHSL